uniref:hydroxymethylbilane synthase n=1 Tax=Ciona savignyi TaxID=51511 RepID=H2ZDA3_CIOSA
MCKNGVIRVGTRKSELAMIQTNWVVNQLKTMNESLEIEIIQMATIGDKILDKSLSKTGEKSLFTKELEDALIAKQVDLVVNSLKDMPSTLPNNLTISAVSRREDPRDAVIMHPANYGKRLEDLPTGSVIGTSSLRRVAQLKKLFPDLKFKSIRGNLNTRLRKLDNGDDFAAIILAVAGVKRMGWSPRISYILTTDECLYAIGQGALGIETRADDMQSIKLVAQLHDKDTVIRTVAERAFLKTLGGGCSVPQAVHSWIEDDQLYMKGAVFNLDGSKSLLETMQTSLLVEDQHVLEVVDPESCCEFASITTSHRFIHPMLLKVAGHLGRDLALLLLGKGAREILDEARRQNMERVDDVI